ncbi:hypothetical protein QFC21_001288 [Naganishia friedmannii]|uniref:Uncharacterized protein n=1 Tax=Naganishia friedmannii TaxID=89922 RepID=A0ACC2W427_9TREE|nr:hypothetical protein QFC21_001288 [Naganishia friedmannii]
MASGLTMEPPEASASASNTQDLQVLILVGLPGSGKSCLANALEGTGRWVRASQDDAPNRRRQEAEAMTRSALRTQRNAVVDRTLEARLATRTGHPTLVDIDMAMRVLNQMQREYKPPRPDQPEGYSRVYVLPESEQPAGGVWSDADLEELLHKVEASSWRDEPYVPPPPTPAPYSKRSYARGVGNSQQGQIRGNGRNYFEGSCTSRGGGYHNSSIHAYRPRYDNMMQGAPAGDPLGHPPFEARPPIQYHQGGYDAGYNDRYPARPVYTGTNPIGYPVWMNRPSYTNQNGYQNSQHQREHWRPPQEQLRAGHGSPFPTDGNDRSNYQRLPPSTHLGAVVGASYMQQDMPSSEQRQTEHAPK